MRGYFRGLFGDDNVGLMNIFIWGNAFWLYIFINGWDGYRDLINELGGIGIFLGLLFWAAQFYNCLAIIYIPVYLLSDRYKM